MSSVLQALEAVSADTGLALPPLLRTLVANDATVYGPDWARTWRERCLGHAPPPLISCYEVEWLDAAGIHATAAEWLNPAFQHGQRFVPFAENGSGDAWCLVPLAGTPEPGVALVAHDSDESEVVYRSLADFACAQLLQALADLSHWVRDERFSAEEACQVVRTDVAQVAAGLDAATGRWLCALSQVQPQWREVCRGPRARPRTVLSLLPDAALQDALTRFPPPDAPALAITARWQCAPAIEHRAALLAAQAPADWRALARDPGRKLAALRAHQQEHGSTLQQAKAAVDDFIHQNPAPTP